nr:thiol:disulfide interchange protein DsbA/DsbL [Ottowia beijingensis]
MLRNFAPAGRLHQPHSRIWRTTHESSRICLRCFGPGTAGPAGSARPCPVGRRLHHAEGPCPRRGARRQGRGGRIFSYGCSHCKNFEPIFTAWKKAAPADVVVRREHVGFQSSFEPLQRIYYALESMGEVDKVHAKVFEALQTQRKRIDKPEVLFPWIAEQGLDRAKFEAAYKSFGVATKVRRAVQLQDAYKVEGTPALGVAGRYYTDGSMAGGFERMIQLANNLIAQERKRG